MSAPPRVIYIDKFSVVDCLKDIGGDWEYILKSDYDELQAQLTLEAMAKVDAQFKCDELQAKLTDAERLNKVALEAIRLAVRQNSCEMVMTGDEIRKCESAIKELERP